MKKKANAVLALIFLVGIIILTQKTGDFIFAQVQEKGREENVDKGSEKRAEENTENKSEERAEKNAENKSKEGTGENTENESEEGTEENIENKSEERTEENIENKSEERAEENAENKSEGEIETVGTVEEKEKQGKNKKSTEGALVVIDAGHGGKDPGKVGINDAEEKEINLKISKKLKKYLEEKGITVVMTREDEDRLADSQVEDLKTRVSLINKTKPKLAVCIHQNSYSDSQVSGVQVFYYTHSKEGKEAAKFIQNAFLEMGSERVRESKANDSYYILKHTEAPILIVECGFLSNPKEADKLITDEYQEEVARIIAEGIQNYLE